MSQLYTAAMIPLPCRVAFIAFAKVVGALTMHVNGIREQGGSAFWTLGYLIGGGVAGAVAAFLVSRCRTHSA